MIPGQRTAQPVTVVVCHGGDCGHDQGKAVVGELRDVIRRRPHGVLVSAGCLLGRLGCHALTTSGTRAPGAMLIVQPCSPGRVPTGPAMLVGPVAADDVALVRAWLDSGDLRFDGLPAHLRQPLSRRGAVN